MIRLPALAVLFLSLCTPALHAATIDAVSASYEDAQAAVALA